MKKEKKEKVCITVKTDFVLDIPQALITETMSDLKTLLELHYAKILGQTVKMEEASIKEMDVRLTYGK